MSPTASYYPTHFFKFDNSNRKTYIIKSSAKFAAGSANADPGNANQFANYLLSSWDNKNPSFSH